MRRVYALYAVRKLTHPRVYVIGFAAALFVLALSVSIKDVIANALSAGTSPDALLRFAGAAVVSTEIFVQIFLVAAAVFLILALRDVCMYCVTTTSVLLKKQAHRS